LNIARSERAGLAQIEFREGRIEALPLGCGTADCVISNGARNASARYGVKSIAILATLTTD